MAGRTVPAIATELQKIKLARAEGDKVGEDIARESYKAKIAQMEAAQYEKQYNTVSSELKKAYTDLRTAESNIAAFKYSSDVAVAETEGRFDVEQEQVKGRQDRKTKLAVLQQEQTYDKEMLDYRTNRALELAEKHRLSKQTQTDIIRALGNTDPQQEAVAIYEATIRDGDRGRDFWRAYNKIDDSKKTNDWEPPSLGQLESTDVGLAALAPLYEIPVKITDINRVPDIFGGKDEVEGRKATEADYMKAADNLYKKARQAAHQGIPPNRMMRIINNLKDGASETLKKYADYLDETDRGIVFNDQDAGSELKDQETLRSIIISIQEAIQINDFFESEPGKQYYNWVNASVTNSFQQGRSAWLNLPVSLEEQSQQQSEQETQQQSQQGTQQETQTEQTQQGQLPRSTEQPTEQTQTQPQSDGSSRLPSVERENLNVQTDVTNMSNAMAKQGWQVGDFLKYSGTEKKLKYMIVQPNMIFRVLGIASKARDGYPYDGVLVQGITMPSAVLKGTTPAERNASRRITRRKMVIPFSMWNSFNIR